MYYINSLTQEQADQMEEQTINRYYTTKRNYTEIQTLGFCQCCNKRLITGDEVYESEIGHFCKESCDIELRRQEDESS